MKYKLYNPFKLWGSYLGGIIALILPETISINITSTQVYNPIFLFMISIVVSYNIGFTFGYIIHNTIRNIGVKE